MAETTTTTASANMDLGAGYDIEDKRVAKAVEIFEETLVPYIKDSPAFAKSNILTISGYGTNLGPRGQKRKAHADDDDTPSSSPTQA